MYIDGNFIETNSTGAQHDVVVAFGVSASNTPIDVLDVSILPAVSANSPNPTANWSGYQFCNNTGGSNSCPATPSTVATGAVMNFTQPNVYVPTGTGAPSCNNSLGCSMAIWDGLQTGGSVDYLLQTGSEAYIRNPGAGQVTNYWLFWEDTFAQSHSTLCTGPLNQNYITPGDFIKPIVELNSGTNKYLVFTDDVTNGNQCSASVPYTWSQTGYFEDFIWERVASGSSLTHLAKFDTKTTGGQVLWGGSWYPISRPYGDGWSTQVLMKNSGTLNMCSGSWSGSTCTDLVSGGITAGTWGSFTATWLSSANT